MSQDVYARGGAWDSSSSSSFKATSPTSPQSIPPLTLSPRSSSSMIASPPFQTSSNRLSHLTLSSLDLDELEPLPPAEAETSTTSIRGTEREQNCSSSPVFASSSKANGPSVSSARSQGGAKASKTRTATRRSAEADHGVEGSISARYVTVSAILSRSGAAIPPSKLDADQLEALREIDQSRKSGLASLPTRERQDNRARTSPPPSFIRRKTFGGEGSKSRAASNGSALEALGALLLQRDSSGKVSNLSFTRYGDRKQGGGGRLTASSNSNKIGHGLSKVSKAWLQGIREAGAAKLGIKIPDDSDIGQTIAQRRARKQGFTFQTLINKGGIETDDEVQAGDAFIRVGTTSAQPTFEVGRPRQLPRLNGQDSFPPAPKIIPQIPPDLELSPSPIFNKANVSDNIARQRDTSVFGAGSAFALNDPPDAPPSPIAMPGAWTAGGPSWSSRSGDWREEGALLLPPPLLDDFGSDAKSFEGLLGVRRMREQERARKQLEKLKARNRPAHKVGMLTAFSNFVKAAHAADKASKAAAQQFARPSAFLARRHTEPAQQPFGPNLNGNLAPIESPAFTEANEDEDTEGEGESESDDQLTQSQEMTRASSQSRKSFESVGRPLDTVYEGRPSLSIDSQGAATPNTNLRRDSIATSRRSSLYDTPAPRAPRLLPIYMSLTSPTTPLALDSNDSHYEMGRPSRGPTAPPTPRLAPTLLSLPPSPWVYATSEDQRSNSIFMNLSMAPVHGPPGTPRLVPTALEIAPSPFPLSPTFNPFGRSPRVSASLAASTTSLTEISQPLELSPDRSPVLTGLKKAPPRLRRRKTPGIKEHEGSKEDDPRLTPSVLIDQRHRLHDGSVDTAGDCSNEKQSVRDETEGKIGGSAPVKRSFLLWFLFGDLGLNTRSTIAAKASGSPLPAQSRAYSRNYGALLGLAAHTYAFTIFVLAHLVDLAYRVGETLSMTFWFLRWMFLNLTGQTVLARCIIDAYQLVQKEWQTVSLEDHEGKGRKKTDRDDTSGESAKGLSRWQVVKGMIELVCLQDVTRERYFKEGAGLEELKGWSTQRRGRREDNPSRNERVDLGVKRQSDRRALGASDDLSSDSDSNNSDPDDDENDSDDDDMVVTRQGPDILEFTKTPRYEHRSYFSQMPVDEPAKRRKSSSDAQAGFNEETRALVKTIKWASRLAISAYGLHVTLVDLPATFTPSGNRFSRQTFAHLSRLHHEDVLHADIQTLDSDAYSPTFYLVRDLSRKVVIVSVRGTQSLQDIIVDLEMVVDEVKLHDGKDSGQEKLYCHAGVLRAAKALICKDSTLFRTLSEALRENADFGIVFTGHSLGGAIASTVVLLLGEFIPEADGQPFDSAESGRWITHDHSGLPAGRTIRAITFAHPATVNASLATRAAQGRIPLVLSVVLGSDIIPRTGHGQAREIRRVLGGLSRVRRRKDDLFHHNRSKGLDGEDDARVHIVTSWWRWKMIRRKERITREEEKLASQIQDDLWTLRCDVENDLYAAIKLRSSSAIPSSRQDEKQNGAEEGEGEEGQGDDDQQEQQRRSQVPPSPWVGPDQRAKAPLHQLASRRQQLDAITLQNEESMSANGILVPAGQSILIYNSNLYRITSPLSFFSLPDFHPRMFAEHFPSAYETALLEDIKL